MYQLAKRMVRKVRTVVRTACCGISDPGTLLQRLERHGGVQVLGGPFAGLKYLPASSGSALFPKLLGTYEQELHPVIARLVESRFDAVVDVGCAEGYYLAGVAHACRRRGLPVPRLTGYDTNPDAIALAAELVRLNDLGQWVAVHQAWFTGQGLEAGRVALICDIEGDEENLLNPETRPALRRVELLVEVHDAPGTSRRLDLLQERFRATHDMQVFRRRERTPADFPAVPLGRLAPRFRLSLMDEQRQFGNTWLHLVPRPVESSTPFPLASA